MPDPVTGIIGGATLLGSVGGSIFGADAAKSAARAQAGAARAGIDEQRRQFDATRALLAPYIQAGQTAIGGLAPYTQTGEQALGQQRALLGLEGAAAQAGAIEQVEASPAFRAMLQQGENAILQNAAATGGLRGGNTQAALAQFRPQILSQLLDQQYARLGGLAGAGLATQSNLASLGQGSAAGQAAFGQQSAAQIGNLLGQQGAAQAGGIVGQANAYAPLFGLPAQLAGIAAGTGALSGGIPRTGGVQLTSGQPLGGTPWTRGF